MSRTGYTTVGIPRTPTKSITELREVFKRHGYSLKTKDAVNLITLTPCRYATHPITSGGSEFFNDKNSLQDYADQLDHMAMLMRV